MSNQKTNEPKVLVEFSPDEIKWLADRLHEESQRAMQAELVVSSKRLTNKNRSLSKKDEAKVDFINQHKKRAHELKNRLLDKAYKQGFGDL